MDFERISNGIALSLDSRGIVRGVLYDAVGLTDEETVGHSLVSLLDRQSTGKGLSFLMALREEGAAFDWELGLPLGERVEILHFAGIVTENETVVIGAPDRQEVLTFYDDLVRVNNEQMNVLRLAMKETAEMAAQREQRDGQVYEELTRLNNELMNLQRELARKNAQLERLNELKNQFLGMAAHDLRNPLAAIMTYSEFIIEDLADGAAGLNQEFIEIIHGSSMFMLGMINDLLDITSIESGRLDLHLELVDLADLIERNVTLNGVLAQRKQIELVFEATDPLPQLLVDRAKIEQVLNNLISNAIKYSYADTQVHIRLGREGGVAQVSVADQGQGIPASELGKLFQYFGRTSVQSTGGERSTGLGLAIARKIVEGHEGRIWVESEPGRGSTFFFTLPLDDDAA